MWGAVMLAVSAGRAYAVGPSFDCGEASTPLTRFICAMPNLSRMDLEFDQAYYALRQQVGPAGLQALKQEAIAFQKQFGQRCGISASGDLPPDAGALGTCLYREYATQRLVWVSRLTGAALQEAARPIEQHLALQRDIQVLGFLPPTQAIDGVYGEGTRSAILSWQHSRNLPETGFLGAADSTALRSQVLKPAHASNSEAAPVAGTADATNSTPADRVAADKRNRGLAFDAQNGDAGALDLLHAGAASGDLSAMYGLSVYLGLEASRKHLGAAIGFTKLIDDYEGDLDPNFKSHIDEIRRLQSGEDGYAEDYRDVLPLLQSAAQRGDPGAMEGLGSEYYNEAIRRVMLLAYFTTDDINIMLMDPRNAAFLRTLKWACANANSLLSLSMKENWPKAFAQLGLINAFLTPKPSSLGEWAGCNASNPSYSEHLIHGAAELGDADSQWELREEYIQEGRTADAAMWDVRLKELADQGDREAPWLITHHQSSNGGTEGAEPNGR
jgi:peptidoglycan hydrolase-like protein with peptidoglycan-binding domain